MGVSTPMTGRRLVRGSVYLRSFGAGAQFPGTHEMILILILIHSPEKLSRVMTTLLFDSFFTGCLSSPTHLQTLVVTSPVSRQPLLHGNIRDLSVSLSTQACSLGLITS